MLLPKKQRGAALITAVLITSLATVLATSMAFRQQVDIRRTANILQGEQAYQYALGLEMFALTVLKHYFDKNPKTDHLQEGWTTPINAPVEEAMASGQLTDASGLFNLNNLINSNGEVDPLAQSRFSRLLDQLAIPTELAVAVVDWLDTNELPGGPSGAEDDVYQNKETPYRAANQKMADISELLLVEGMSEHYMKLKPFVTALPEQTAINVNTAPAEVIMALADNIDFKAVEAMVKERENAAFDSIGDFKNHTVFSGLNENDKPKVVRLDVKSSYFTALIHVSLGQTQVHLKSLIFRKQDGKAVVKTRSQGAF